MLVRNFECATCSNKVSLGKHNLYDLLPQVARVYAVLSMPNGVCRVRSFLRLCLDGLAIFYMMFLFTESSGYQHKVYLIHNQAKPDVSQFVMLETHAGS